MAADLRPVPAGDVVPGVMRCDGCKFELTRINLNVNVGTVTAGDLAPEPCPNGCGPLRPTTWRERANEAMDTAESMFDRAIAAEKSERNGWRRCEAVLKFSTESTCKSRTLLLTCISRPMLAWHCLTEGAMPDAGIKGCTHIYAPAGQAGEYAPLACNPYRGCGHGCAYCYVPGVLKMKRAEFDAGAVPRDGFLVAMTKDAKKYQAAGCREQVMLSFTTDPYHPGDTTLTRQTLEVLRDHGLGFCTLTKGGTRALRDMDLFRPDRDAFASTLTSLDEAFSRKWERGAALPKHRLMALQQFHDAGIFTWVSLEPTLDVDASLAIVRETHRYVDLFKIGRANYLPMTKTTDWQDYTLRMIDLCVRLGVQHYVKKDLQPFLPPGYPNPLRVPQHHGAEDGNA